MNWDILIAILSWACFLSGGFFLFVGSLGMVRLGDFWARVHAASIIDSAGIGLLLLGMMIQTGFTLITVKFILIVLFLLITGPTASHAVVNAAFMSGSRPADLTEDETAVETPKASSKKTKKTQVRKSVS